MRDRKCIPYSLVMAMVASRQKCKNIINVASTPLDVPPSQLLGSCIRSRAPVSSASLQHHLQMPHNSRASAENVFICAKETFSLQNHDDLHHLRHYVPFAVISHFNRRQRWWDCIMHLICRAREPAAPSRATCRQASPGSVISLMGTTLFFSEWSPIASS